MNASRTRRLITVLLSAVMLIGIAAPANAAIRFERIRYDAPGKDTRTNAHLNQELVVLVNTGAEARNIGGWTVRDLAGRVYRIPKGFRLRPSRRVRIHTGKGTDTGTDLFWGSGNYIWNNNKDRATLKNPAGRIVHRCRYNDGTTKENRTTRHCLRR